MRRAIFMAVVVCMLALTQSMASAASVHLKGGKNAAPAFTDGGLHISAAGELSGLGNGDVLIDMVATADVVSTCANQIKNGNTPFSVASIPPDPVIAGAPDCPNPNWTETIDDLLFTSVTITVEQPAGTIVLTVTCTLDPATLDGPVSKQDVSCTQS
jgi:hypothetical protein